MISQEDLKKKIADLPPLPGVVMKLMNMCRDPEVAPRDIVEVIRHDPALTMKVLRLCNSTFYGLPRKVSSLQEAMVFIGTEALVNFVLAGQLSQYYQGDFSGYGLEQGQLWRHAVGTAICAQRVAEYANPDYSDVAFTCGLVHCVGKIVLNNFVAEEILSLLEVVEKQGKPFMEAEKNVLGMTHAEIGAAVAEQWELPEEIVETIRHYQDPLQAGKHKQLVAIVHVGNILCVSFGIGVGSDGLAYVFHPGAMELLQLKVDQLFALSVEIHDQFKNAEDLLSLA